MSKERELLARHCNWKLSPEEHLKLLYETKELLAQPEQPEQEPVAWKETLIEHFQSAFDSEMYRTDEGEELILLEDAICYVEEFAPPKREPLSDDEVIAKYRDIALDNTLYVPSYYAGFRDAEKAHGIGVDDE